MEDLKILQDEKLPNYRDMAEQYLMPHKHHLALHFWCKNDRESMFMPLLFTSYDNYLQSKSFQEGLNWMEDLKICQNPTKYWQVMFCEAVKVDMTNSKDSSFHHTITSTLSPITVLFEDLFEAITSHRDFSGPWTIHLITE
jgi:hypothetical protein